MFSSKLLRSSRERQRGTASVEFAVVLPFLVTLLLAIWEVGRLIEIEQIMSNAAREGAHMAAAGQASSSQVQTLVTNYLSDAGLPTTNVTVTVTNQGFSGNPAPPDNEPTSATRLDEMQVVVTIPFNDVRWLALYWFTSTATNLTGQATWNSFKDYAYPEVSYPPVG